MLLRFCALVCVGRGEFASKGLGYSGFLWGVDLGVFCEQRHQDKQKRVRVVRIRTSQKLVVMEAMIVKA